MQQRRKAGRDPAFSRGMGRDTAGWMKRPAGKRAAPQGGVRCAVSIHIRRLISALQPLQTAQDLCVSHKSGGENVGFTFPTGIYMVY